LENHDLNRFAGARELMQLERIVALKGLGPGAESTSSRYSAAW
jgi:hypothetical protein